MPTSLKGDSSASDDRGSPKVSTSPSDRPCVNCGASRAGPFCAQCGQPLVVERLSLRGLAGNLAQAFDLDRGLVGTTLELFRHPHRVVVDYLRGRTVPYTNPVKHFALALSITQVVALASGATGEFASGLTEGSTDAEVTRSRVVGILDRFFVLLAAPAVLVLAAVQRVVFHRARWTFAEHLASALFIAGNQLLLWVPALVMAGGTRKSLVGNVMVGITLLALLAYYAWAARGLYGGSVLGTLGRAIAVTGLSALISMALLTLALFVLVL